MDMQIDQEKLERLQSYHLPTYKEIPDVGLYLNQCAKYINGYLEPLFAISITESMISNYVKRKLVSNPIKKQYSRDQIAYLMFIAVGKSVVSLDDLQLLLSLQQKNYGAEESYEYFRVQFESIIKGVFGLETEESVVGKKEDSLEKVLLRNLLVALAHKTYVDLAFDLLENSMIGKNA